MQISNGHSKEGVAEFLSGLEAEYGIRLPSEYRNFMVKYNGGDTPETTMRLKNGKKPIDIGGFYSTQEGVVSLESMSRIMLLSDYIDIGQFPAVGIEDGYFTIGINEDNYGKIFHYDSRRNKIIQEAADSFYEFIGLCVTDIKGGVWTFEERHKAYKDSHDGNEPSPQHIEIWKKQVAEETELYGNLVEVEISPAGLEEAEEVKEFFRTRVQSVKKDYGIFIVTKLVDSGRPVNYCWRQEPDEDEEVGTNGWMLFSGEEDQKDMGDLVLVGIKDIERVAPGLIPIFDAPVGSEIGFLYDESGKHGGYFDMIQQKAVTVEDILNPSK